MENDNKAPIAEAISAGTVTDQEAKDDNTLPEVTVEVQSDSDLSTDNEVIKDPDKVKETFDKLRKERDEEKKARKALETRFASIESELRKREEKQAEEEGNYKLLYEKKIEEAFLARQEKEGIEAKYDSEKASYSKKEKALNTALNDMIDSNLESWPEEAKSFVDAKDKISANERLAQYNKALPLVKKFASEPAKPGTSPSPRDQRDENPNNSTDEEIKRYASMRNSGLYRM